MVPKGMQREHFVQGSWSQPCHAKVSEVAAWTYHKEPGIIETHCPLAPSSFPCSAFPFRQSTYQGLADQFSVNATPPCNFQCYILNQNTYFHPDIEQNLRKT